jgi:hypothetical protein
MSLPIPLQYRRTAGRWLPKARAELVAAVERSAPLPVDHGPPPPWPTREAGR